MIKRIIMGVLLSLISVMLLGQSYSTIEQDVHRFTLENGATLLVLPRTNVPIVHCVTLVDVGSTREEAGIRGISHYLEHMAFKGTETIGTTDFAAESFALEESNRIFDEILAERAKGENADPEVLVRLEQELEEAIEYAGQYVIDNEFSRIMDLNGSKNLNAGTGVDLTMYTMSLPSNKLELWMLMESDRFINPVFRQLHQERDVILEEKRMYDSYPSFRFAKEFVINYFSENPYRHPIIGYEEDIKSITERQMRDYFESHYGAQNLVFSIVGDVQPERALELANIYLARIPAGSKNEPVTFNEPAQTEERLFIHEDLSQESIIMIGYTVPPMQHPDFPIYNVISDILGQGRSSRLHRALTEDNRYVSRSFSYAGSPGRVNDNLFVILAYPLPGVEIDVCLEEIDRQIHRLQTEPVSEEELAGVIKRATMRSIQRLRSGLGLSIQLASYESLFGGYQELFREMEMVEKITPADIMRVANEALVPENRTVGILQPKER